MSERETALKETVNGDTSDGYHTFNELYAYRKAYHALVVNEWARQGRYGVHKSWRHSDGELCFGGGWFIVVAETPEGQVSNHYKADDWTLFQCQESERGNEWDGHTPQIALARLLKLAGADPVPVCQWREIATAPKDADLILLYQAGEGVRAGYWDTITDPDRPHWFSPESQLITGGQVQPTHWMPLPAPPVALVPAEGEPK